MSEPYSFLVESYDTERLKTLSVWSEFAEADLGFRPVQRARTPLEHMVHQCVSEDAWMRMLFGITVSQPALPTHEDRASFIRHYAAVSGERIAALRDKPAEWWAEETTFFTVPRSRAWAFTRRLTHSAHHRGQLTVYLRLLGKSLYSTYGPTADTGGLFANGAPTIYHHASLESLVASNGDAPGPALPGETDRAVTERA